MRLAVSNIAWEAKNDKIVYEYMKECGFEGVEIAPTRWIQENPYEHAKEAALIAEELPSSIMIFRLLAEKPAFFRCCSISTRVPEPFSREMNGYLSSSNTEMVSTLAHG